MEIQYISKPELDHPDMIAAWPGMGYIAKISADYLRRRLNAKLFAEVTYYHNMLVYHNGQGAFCGLLVAMTLSLLDWGIVALYSITVVLIGIFAGRKEKDAEDYFLGGRRMPWWAVMVSIYATALSAVTYIGVPGVAYAGDFHYLQLGLGDFFGRILIAVLLLRAYYRGRVMSVYELLGQRFGPWSHATGTGFFIVTRLLASGVRLAGCAIALSVIFCIPLGFAIALVALYALTYTSSAALRQ